MKNKGFEKYGFRPVGNQVALILNNDDLIVLNSPYAKKPEEASIVETKKPSIIMNAKGKPIFKGKTVEEEEKEESKKNRTFTIASLSNSVEANESSEVAVGDEISIKDCQIAEVEMDGLVFGIVDYHRILLVHKDKINPGA